MKKKGLALLVALMLVFGLVACKDKTTTTIPTTAAPTTTAPVTTAFSVKLSGVTDAGFTNEDKIIAGEWFDLLAGVSAMGSDGVDYKNNIQFLTIDDACYIEDGKLKTTGPKTCTVTYRVVVQGKMDSVDRTIKISSAPITTVFVETDKWNNETLLGTDYTIQPALTADAVTNTWYYWTNIATVSAQISNNQLVIDQEAIGGNDYSYQIKVKTDIELEKKRSYKLTFTVDAEVARYIDIVVKAENADSGYTNDAHNIFELQAGVHEYEIVFVAPQTLLHLNIMTGSVESETRFGLLKFSDFTLFEGPIEIQYEELTDFFKNDAITVGTAMEYITGTDSDYVREFYYWDQSSGALLEGEYVEGGFELTVLTAATETWGAQLQWNDLTKAGTELKKGANYKLSFTITSTTARLINLQVTGATNSDTISKEQMYELAVGENEIVMEFQSLYSYFFMKVHFGNYGDVTQTGTFTFTNMKLFEEKGAVAEPEPVDEGTPIGNIFGTPTNANGALVINPDPLPVGEIHLWAGIAEWFGEWTEIPEVTGTYNNGKLALNIVKTGAPEFWAIQLKYAGGALSVGTDYVFAFTLNSTVARKINVQLKNASFGAAYVDQEIVLVEGMNFIEIPFKATVDSFNFQMNLGKFEDKDETGSLTFEQFTVTRPFALVEDFVVNGDFETAMATLGTADSVGWAVWTGGGYVGTQTITGGKLEVATTTKGTDDWNAQVQYNDPAANLIVDAMYKVELDVNSSVATQITLQFKGATNEGPHSNAVVNLVAGDNHVVVYLKAVQKPLKLFILLGTSEVGTLSFDNILFYAPVMPTEEEPAIDYWPIENGIQNGNFDAVGFAVNGEGSGWTSWTTIDQSWASTQIDATFNVVDGKVVVETLGTGGEVWYIQLCYRPTDPLLEVVPGRKYKVEFDVNASVAGTFSMEMSTTGDKANVAIPVTLVVGDNHVVVEYVAYEANFKLTACLGLYGLATLTFDNFKISEEVTLGYQEVENGIQNGNFDAVGFAVNGEGSGWTSWTTIDQSWASTQIDATFNVVDGKVVVETLGTGGEVWYIQLCYRPTDPLLEVVPGRKYKVEFDVNASVAGTFSMEMSTTGDKANVAIPVTLVVGDNHVVVEYVAYEANFKLTACLGLYGLATLTFDNFKISEAVPFDFSLVDNGIQNGNFDAVGFAVNGEGSGWTSWTTIDQSWASTQIDATFNVVDGKVVVETLGTGGEVWYIQLCYRPTDPLLEVVPGRKYKVEFDVNASVAGTFSMEMSTTGDKANVAIPVTLVVGDNHVVVEYVAYEANFKLTACLGLYGLATLTFDNFVISEFGPRI